jgi:hypothetical protein
MNMLKPGTKVATPTKNDDAGRATSSWEQQELPNTAGTHLSHHADVFSFPVGHARQAFTVAHEKSKGEAEGEEQSEHADEEETPANTVEDLEAELLNRIRERRGSSGKTKKTCCNHSCCSLEETSHGIRCEEATCSFDGGQTIGAQVSIVEKHPLQDLVKNKEGALRQNKR